MSHEYPVVRRQEPADNASACTTDEWTMASSAHSETSSLQVDASSSDGAGVAHKRRWMRATESSTDEVTVPSLQDVTNVHGTHPGLQQETPEVTVPSLQQTPDDVTFPSYQQQTSMGISQHQLPHHQSNIVGQVASLSASWP